MENNKDIFNPLKENFKNSLVSNMDEYSALYKESIENSEAFWKKQANEMLRWQHDFESVSNCELEEGMISWFLGGKLKAGENCVDRHAKEAPRTGKGPHLVRRDCAVRKRYPVDVHHHRVPQLREGSLHGDFHSRRQDSRSFGMTFCRRDQ